MRFSTILIVTTFLSGCSPASSRRNDETIRASWRPRTGDVFIINLKAIQEGSGAGTMIVTGDLSIQEVRADGGGRGTYQLLRLELRENGEASPTVLYENGTLRTWKQGSPPDAGMLAKPLPVVLLPTGKLEAQAGALPWNPVPFDALGVWLPGRNVLPGEKWTRKVRAAYSDWVEVEYTFEVVQGRLRIVGRSTAKAEEEHKILIRCEGSFLPNEGYLSDAWLDIDFSPLKSGTRRKISYEIRRR